MITYEYKCSKCTTITIIKQKITEEALKDCPACGSLNSLTKGLQPSKFKLKGEFH